MNFLTLWSLVVFVVCSLLWLVVMKVPPQTGRHEYLQVDESRYIKLNNLGQPINAKMGPWHCVLDTKTQLVWEVKSPQEDIHYRKSMYSWFDGNLGDQGAGTCHSGEALYGCDTSDLTLVSQKQNFCGISHWRIPTVSELQTLIYPLAHEGRAKTNRWLFPRTYRGPYWSSDVAPKKQGGEEVKIVNFSSGKIGDLATSKVAALRLVASINE